MSIRWVFKNYFYLPEEMYFLLYTENLNVASGIYSKLRL